MNVTINTDASHSDEFKCGAFAFWMLCDAGKYQKAGELKGEILSSNHAEASCIANALHTLKHSKYTDIKLVVINTDSKYCIDILSGIGRVKGDSIRKVFDEIQILIFEICLKYGFTLRDAKKIIQFRHVKAHTSKKDGRSECNRWCDKHAKLYLKQIINKKTNGH